MIRIVWLSVLLLASAAFAQGGPRTEGKSTILGLTDAGTLPVSKPGALVFDYITGVPLVGDGGTWSPLGSGSGSGAASSSDLTNQPTTPFQDGGSNTQLFSKSIGPCGVPFYVDATGAPRPWAGVGPNRWIGSLQSLATGTSFTVGIPAPTAISGASHVATTFSIGGNFHTTLTSGAIRTTAAAADSQAGIRSSTGTAIFRGMDDGGTYLSGGFVVYMRVGSGTADSDQRIFWGLYGTSADQTASNDPDVALDTLYIGANAADANLSACSNDSSGLATCTTLGANFPAKAYGYYDIWFCAPAAASSVGYYIRRLDSRTHPEASGTISSDLPAANLVLYPHMYLNSGPTGSSSASLLDSDWWMMSLQ